MVRYHADKSPRNSHGNEEGTEKVDSTVYEVDGTMKARFPAKNTEDTLEKLGYCKQLISIIKENEKIYSYPKVQEKLNLLEEMVRDDLEYMETYKDGDVRTGYKTANTSFFGYKTHIAMTEERMIPAATIPSGEKTDGKELVPLVEKRREAGMEIETVIGDKAYLSKENIDAAKEEETR